MQDLAPALAVAALLAFIWGVKYLKGKKLLQEREMLHRERMLAMEKGIPLPELRPQEDVSLSALRLNSSSQKHLISKISLGCGLIACCLGAGMILGLQLSPEQDVRNVWSLGFIPLLLGGGLLLYAALYYFLFRRSDS